MDNALDASDPVSGQVFVALLEHMSYNKYMFSLVIHNLKHQSATKMAMVTTTAQALECRTLLLNQIACKLPFSQWMARLAEMMWFQVVIDKAKESLCKPHLVKAKESLCELHLVIPTSISTIFSDTPAIDDGAKAAQISVGHKSLIPDVYSMSFKSDTEFVHVLEDNIHCHGAMDVLVSGSAHEETSKKV